MVWICKGMPCSLPVVVQFPGERSHIRIRWGACQALINSVPTENKQQCFWKTAISTPAPLLAKAFKQLYNQRSYLRFLRIHFNYLLRSRVKYVQSKEEGLLCIEPVLLSQGHMGILNSTGQLLPKGCSTFGCLGLTKVIKNFNKQIKSISLAHHGLQQTSWANLTPEWTLDTRRTLMSKLTDIHYVQILYLFLCCWMSAFHIQLFCSRKLPFIHIPTNRNINNMFIAVYSWQPGTAIFYAVN